MSDNKQAFRALVERVGPEKMLQFTHKVSSLGDLLNIPPGAVVALLAQAPQADLEAIKTPKGMFQLLAKQHMAFLETIFDHVEDENGAFDPVDLSFVKELAEVTGAAAALDAEAAPSAGVAIDPVHLVPGTGTTQ